MTIPPILLLAIGAGFAFIYGSVITIGWALTRRNRRLYHQEEGISRIQLFDLENWTPLGQYKQTISLEKNSFVSNDNEKIDIVAYSCFIVAYDSVKFPKISKGDLILLDKSNKKVCYCFKVPDLSHYS